MKSSYRVVVMADSSKPSVGTNEQMLRSLLTNIKSLSPQPEFIVFVGDMVYGGANVDEQLNSWKSIVQDYYPLNLFYTVLGSHENNETAFSNAFPYLPNDQLPGYQRTVYYFDYGNARFIILNSNRPGIKWTYAIDAKQRAWLEHTLKHSRQKYNFVFFHVPAYPTGHHYGESLDLSSEERDALWKIIDRYNVSAVFVGHEHNYCRRLVDESFDAANLSIKNPIYQITTGGAGSSLNAHITDVKNVMSGPFAIYHYCVLDINDYGVSLQVYDYTNNLIDSCSIIPRYNEQVSSAPTDILIPLGASWKYLDNGTNQNTLWKELYFDDSCWPSGLAELGYGDGGETTLVNYGPDVSKKYITTYFRKHFNISDASLYKKLNIRILRDDGAVVYLNGREVYRTNMPYGEISYNTLAVKGLYGLEEISYENAAIDASFLRNGYNVIAVEVHQATPSSSDMSFNLQLLADK